LPSALKYPTDLFHLRDDEDALYGDFPELKKCVHWFVSRMSPEAWQRRRGAAAKRFYEALNGENKDTAGIYYDKEDQFGWYLFQGEAFTDHPWNYEVFLVCHIVPIFASIGANLELLSGIAGFEERATQLIHKEKNQPNGGLFEILVAAAYARDGWTVAFKPKQKGVAKTYDLDVTRGPNHFAVECKRMEIGEYVERERARMRQLWQSPAKVLAQIVGRNSIVDVDFKRELQDVPDRYLLEKVAQFTKLKSPDILRWDDEVGSGSIKDLDLRPIQESLRRGYLLYPGPVFNSLLTGEYRRYESMLSVTRLQFGPSPHFVDEIDLAVVARWSTSSEIAIDKRARDIHAKLVEANMQLPTDIPGIIHVGFESISGDEVEQRRFEKIIQRAREFERGGSMLEFIHCHYFAPETSPDVTWAMDETSQWIGIRDDDVPLRGVPLLLPDREPLRTGVHWDGMTPRDVGGTGVGAIRR